MTVRGHVRNGVVVLDDQLLPEGTEVICTVVVHTDVQPAETEPQPFEFLMKYAGVVKGTPPDLAKNHDVYLYGQSGKE